MFMQLLLDPCRGVCASHPTAIRVSRFCGRGIVMYQIGVNETAQCSKKSWREIALLGLALLAFTCLVGRARGLPVARRLAAPIRPGCEKSVSALDMP